MGLKNSNKKTWVFACILLVCMIVGGCSTKPVAPQTENMPAQENSENPGYADLGEIPMDKSKPDDSSTDISSSPAQDGETEPDDEIPVYSGQPYTALNGNIPEFPDADRGRTDPFEEYSSLDRLGRCGTAYANICMELMPDSEREGISEVKPSGWNNKPYDFVDGGYLYNRCHLIGFQLAGENANEKNLITGTRYLNIEGMLPFENMVADYVKETKNHVLYRVTPVYEGDNLVTSGVQMEGYSVEDNGAGILFNVYCYNVQPGVSIDYADGSSHESREVADAGNSIHEGEEEEEGDLYIINTNTGKFHLPDCVSAQDISTGNRMEYRGDRDMLLEDGYSPCGRCKP